MNAPGDTEPSGPPTDPDMIDAMAADLAALEAAAHGIGDGLHELVQRLQAQAADARRGQP